MFYKYKKISRELYEWCLREKLCDKGLCAKWKKPGYERLCSVQAIKTNNTNYGSVSICRVPRQELEPGSQIQSQLTDVEGVRQERQDIVTFFRKQVRSIFGCDTDCSRGSCREER